MPERKLPVVLIPSLEPDDRLPTYVIELMENGFSRVVVVNDGSSAAYQPIFDRIAGLGRLAKYALTHRINYFAVLASLALILIALLILFPSRKPRRKDQPKFGRDYNVEDFTI